MTARALTELASELGCRSAYELITSKQYHNQSKGLRLFRDGEEIWPYKRDDQSFWFLGISGYEFRTLKLTFDIAQSLTTTEREYRRLLNIPFILNQTEFDNECKPNEFNGSNEVNAIDTSKEYYRTALIVSAMCVGAILAFYKQSTTNTTKSK